MGATKNKFICNDIEVKNGVTFSFSTTTTSVTFVTNITTFSTASTLITFTKQTAYLETGVITSFSTVTTTTVLSST